MTLEDLIVRCMQINSNSAPSISYLSLIENGKRNPSNDFMESICEIFQKNKSWFEDKNILPSNEKANLKNQFEFLLHSSILCHVSSMNDLPLLSIDNLV